MWRSAGGGIPHSGNSSHGHSPKPSRWKTHQGTVRTRSSSSLWSCLNWNLSLKEPWKYFYRSSTAANGLHLYCIFAEKSLLLPELTLESCPSLMPSVKLPTFDLLGGYKAQEWDLFNRGERERIWLIFFFKAEACQLVMSFLKTNFARCTEKMKQEEDCCKW